MGDSGHINGNTATYSTSHKLPFSCASVTQTKWSGVRATFWTCCRVNCNHEAETKRWTNSPPLRGSSRSPGVWSERGCSTGRLRLCRGRSAQPDTKTRNKEHETSTNIRFRPPSVMFSVSCECLVQCQSVLDSNTVRSDTTQSDF